MNPRRFVGVGVLLLVSSLVVPAPTSQADPPVIPPTPPPLVPCQPLICVQLIDAVEIAPDHWRFEVEALNWTAFTDRTCPPTDPNCVDRSSPGAAAEGLVFVRNAALSTVQFRVLPVDPNGAPLGIESVTEDLQVEILPGGETAVDLDRGFVDRVVSVFDLDAATGVPPACFELTDPIEGIVTFSDDPLCDTLVMSLDMVQVEFEAFLGPSNVEPNKWSADLCTADQIVWTQDPTMPMPIPPGDTNVQPSCPTTCQDKDALGNVLQGFVFEVEDFQPGDRLVFNWYLLGPSGPIASGSPPTPADSGTLAPSPSDPWGFSFGSFQIDRKVSCVGGGCDTTILVQPPVTDPAVSCLVDEALPRDDLPFDFYISLAPAGVDPPCNIEPAVARDARGIERLVVRATAGSETDRMVITFENLENGAVTTESFSLTSGSRDVPTETLVGRYEVGGICENTITNQFFFLDKFTFAVPRRGDLPDVVSSTRAYEIDEATGTLALTESFAGGALALGSSHEVHHFFQVTDTNGETHVVGTADGAPDTLFRQGALLVRDTAAPQIVDFEPTVDLGTELDGGADCAVDFTVRARATDAAGGFTLSEDLNNTSTRSFGTTVGGTEEANLATTGTVSVGSPVTVTFEAVDDAGNTSGPSSTTVTVTDDTLPLVDCTLIEQMGGNNGGGGGGPGNGQGPGGGGPPGQGGNGGGPPPNLPNSGFFVVDFSGSDNCQPPFGLTLSAEIDGITVQNGDTVQIVQNGTTPSTSTLQPDGSIRIDTAGNGTLTVTATDQASNVSQCTAVAF